MRLRVRLHIACVRSTLLYDIHAVGAPVEVLRKLDAFDARSLRSIVQSHAHMTHESTTSLRKNIGVTSPCDSILALLKSRSQRSSEDASQKRFAQLHLDILKSQASSQAAPALGESAYQAWGVPCHVCGQYFLNTRIMRSHNARKRKPAVADPITQPKRPQVRGVTPAECYGQFAKDGMPTCRLSATELDSVVEVATEEGGCATGPHLPGDPACIYIGRDSLSGSPCAQPGEVSCKIPTTAGL